MEQKGAENLQKWQARKLLDLHSQYQECLKDIGLGHKEAELVTKEESKAEQPKIVKEKSQKTTKKPDAKEKATVCKKPAIQEKTIKLTGCGKPPVISQIYKKKVSPFKRKKVKKKVTSAIIVPKVLSESDESENEVPHVTVNISQKSTNSSSATSIEGSKKDQCEPTTATQDVKNNDSTEQTRNVSNLTVLDMKESRKHHARADSVSGKIVLTSYSQ